MEPGLLFGNTVGVFLLGLVSCSVLYGIVCCQSYKYFQSYPRDPFIVKTTVISFLILETLHTSLLTYAAYSYFVINYMIPMETVWSLAATIPVMSLIIFITHLFYAIQIYQFRRGFWLPGLIMALGLTQLGFSIALTGIGLQPSALQIIFPREVFLILVPLVTTGVGDAICAGTLCYYLYINQSGVQRTDSLIRKIMIYAISTGVIMSAVAILVVIMLLLQPTNFIYLSILEAGANLYVVSVLARLNSRTPRGTSSAINGEVESNLLTTFRAATFNETTAEASFNGESSGGNQELAKPPTESSSSWVDPSSSSLQMNDLKSTMTRN